MQNYNSIQKLLHDIVLNNKFINKSLFELEKIIYLKQIKLEDKPHIFITGLPRSGTTSLLNFIYSSNEFASLTYKNMPFILSPNLFKTLYKKNILKKERLHADGISFDINSPEAFDEVFFNNKNDYIKNELSNYINLILSSEKKERYLSKNNLNFNRIDLINSILSKCIFLIPIREPLQHAYSLLNQHKHFIKLQKKDDFIRRYMNYLGHNEFGLNHKPWNLPLNFNELDNINYWLEQWCLFYDSVFEKYKNHTNCFFIIYEKLIDPNYIKILLEKINLSYNDSLDLNFFKNANKKEIKADYSTDTYKKAKIVYENFNNRTLKI